jgi:formate dehydrogenase subunit delta
MPPSEPQAQPAAQAPGMTEKLGKLIRVANQAADFFAPYGDEKAVAGIEEHIRAFWTKRMRRELADYAAAGGAGLHPQVREAIRRAGPVDAKGDEAAEKAAAE